MRGLPRDLAALARLSARIGEEIALVQGAGGNSSIKIGDILWVKASGTWLAEAMRQPVFVPVALGDARRALETGDDRIPALRHRAVPERLRPSIETSLHALMPHRVVLHVHGVNTLAWSVRADAPAALCDRLAGLDWAWLPYCRPGLPLTAAVAKATSGRAPDILVLGNHGLVVGAADCDAAEALTRDVERRLEVPARPAPPPDLDRLDALCRDTSYRPAAFAEAHWAGTDRESCAIAAGGSLYPDHVVFLGPGATVADAVPGEGAPAFLLLPGIGAVLRADLPAGAEAMLRCLGLVASRLPRDAALRYLSAEEAAALLSWDAERYRKAVSQADCGNQDAAAATRGTASS